MNSLFVFKCSIIFVILVQQGSECSLAEKRLLQKLLDNYNIMVRPVANFSEPVQVSFGITLMQILQVDENLSHLQANVWQTLEWNDTSLVWNPSEYDNITDIRLPMHRIWSPDIYAYNTASETHAPAFNTHAVVRNTGKITYIPPGIITATCKLAYDLFPFDEQKCELKFGSWTYDGGQLNLTVHSEDGGDTSSFIPNDDWSLHGLPGRRHAVYYTCCPDPYVDITFVVSIKRRGEAIMSTARYINLFIIATLFTSFLIQPCSYHKIIFALIHVVNSFWVRLYYEFRYPKLIQQSGEYGYWSPHFRFVAYFKIVHGLGLLVFFANVLSFWLYSFKGQMPNLVQKVINSRMANTLCQNLVAKRHDDQYVLRENDGLVNQDLATAHHAKINDWQYMALLLNRCFLILFTFIAVVFWLTLFP